MIVKSAGKLGTCRLRKSERHVADCDKVALYDWWLIKGRLIAAYRTLRPWMMRTSTTTMAITSRMWIRPPMVYEVTTPKSHKITRTTQIVQSIKFLPRWFLSGYPDGMLSTFDSVGIQNTRSELPYILEYVRLFNRLLGMGICLVLWQRKLQSELHPLEYGLTGCSA